MRTRDQITADVKPFADTAIRYVPPRNEAYVPWMQYAQRLLLTHGAHRYTITSITAGPNGWAVAVRVQFADHEWYDGVGFDSDDATHAESQAYKRACAKAGIGLHLYADPDKGTHFWLYNVLTESASDAVKKRRTAKDYEDAARALVRLFIEDGDEADKAWPLLLEQARLEAVASKKDLDTFEAALNTVYKGSGK